MGIGWGGGEIKGAICKISCFALRLHQNKPDTCTSSQQPSELRQQVFWFCTLFFFFSPYEEQFHFRHNDNFFLALTVFVVFRLFWNGQRFRGEWGTRGIRAIREHNSFTALVMDRFHFFARETIVANVHNYLSSIDLELWCVCVVRMTPLHGSQFALGFWIFVDCHCVIERVWGVSRLQRS